MWSRYVNAVVSIQIKKNNNEIELHFTKGKKTNVVHNNTADEISLSDWPMDNRWYFKNTPFFMSLVIKSQSGSSNLQTNLKCGLLNTYVSFFFS